MAVSGLLCAACFLPRASAWVAFATDEDHGIAQTAPDRSAKFLGDAACVSCHRQLFETYSHTSHHLTSQHPDKTTILGSFASDRNSLMISSQQPAPDEPRLSFQMQETPDGFFQEAVAELDGRRLTHSARIDVVIGSGTRGQSYLSWRQNQLFELPVSYWSDGRQWINSPGYRDGTANFDRKVDPRCLECHTTYIRALSDDPQTNRYDPATLIVGISCESCHGPGSDHVAQQRMHTPASAIDRILNPAKFSRDRQIDQCALCHNGTARAELAPAFTYSPGDDLSRFLAPSALDAEEHPDVHGNQVGLLKRSQCFLSSPTMSCSTCHNVHAPEKAASDYSQRCLECHEWQSCGKSKTLGKQIVNDCIQCHMPLEQTNAIVSETAGRMTRTSIRTHWIKVYPDTQHP